MYRMMLVTVRAVLDQEDEWQDATDGVHARKQGGNQ